MVSQVLDAVDVLRSKDRDPRAVPPRALADLPRALPQRGGGGGDGDDDDDDECDDSNGNCRDWAAAGECDKNPSYMHAQCAYSCPRGPPPNARAEPAAEARPAAAGGDLAAASRADPPKVPPGAHSRRLAGPATPRRTVLSGRPCDVSRASALRFRGPGCPVRPRYGAPLTQSHPPPLSTLSTPQVNAIHNVVLAMAVEGSTSAGAEMGWEGLLCVELPTKQA